MDLLEIVRIVALFVAGWFVGGLFSRSDRE